MEVIVAIYLFILGLIFGSFILVVVDRMRVGRGWVRGRSSCDSCKHTLHTIDLIPLLSWLSTRGRCRYCKTKLSSAYPLTELTLGITFAVSYLVWPYELTSFIEYSLFALWLTALVLLAGLFVYDLRWFILPNKLIHPLIVISLLFAITKSEAFGEYTIATFVNYLASIAVGAGFFLLLYLFSKGKWIGDGDIRLGVAIGLFTGSWIQSWLVIFIASLVGIILVLPSLVKKDKKKVLKMKIPFGPLLIIGLYITVLFGQRLIDWYTSEVLLL